MGETLSNIIVDDEQSHQTLCPTTIVNTVAHAQLPPESPNVDRYFFYFHHLQPGDIENALPPAFDVTRGGFEGGTMSRGAQGTQIAGCLHAPTHHPLDITRLFGPPPITRHDEHMLLT
ncbi:hypothetical protein DXG01_016918 [Tephrocybe rancida]|nr:hypothetical protein DXG01_016918 [Tephrocybe rancida]